MGKQANMNEARLFKSGRFAYTLKNPLKGGAKLRGVPDLTDLGQFTLFEKGNAIIACIDSPTFLKDIAKGADGAEIGNMLTNFVSIVENEFKELSGLNGISAETTEIGNNVAKSQMITNVEHEISGTFSTSYLEKVGSPITKFVELYLTAIKDPLSKAKTYYGLLQDDYSYNAGFEKEVFSFLYVVTDNSFRFVEKAYYFTNCQIQSIDMSHYEHTSGSIEQAEISLEFSYVALTGIKVNKAAHDFLNWMNSDQNPNMIELNMFEKEYKAYENLEKYTSNMKNV